MLHVCQILLPLFSLIALGYFGGYKTVGDKQSQALNSFVYYYSFPALIITSLFDKNIVHLLNYRFIIGYLLASIIIFTIGAIISTSQHTLSYRFLVGLSASFPNCGYIGIPLITALFGADIPLAAIVATVLSLLHMTWILLFIELFTIKKDDGCRRNLLTVFKRLLLNPMILCFIIGLMLSALQLTLPTGILVTLRLLASACIPCALFGIGHNLAITKKKIGLDFRSILSVFLLKNIAQALLAWGILYHLHVASQWIAVGVLMSSLSTGLVIPILANKYQVYQHEAPQAVFVTTIASLVSLSLWVTILQYVYPSLSWQ